MKKVTTIVLNGFTNDSRVLKENLSLKKAGYDVKILALHKEGLKEFEIVEGLAVHRLSMKKKVENLKKTIKNNDNIDDKVKIIEREDNEVLHILEETSTSIEENNDFMDDNDITQDNNNTGISNTKKNILEINKNFTTSIEINRRDSQEISTIAFSTLHDNNTPFFGKLIILLKLFLTYMRRFRRFLIRVAKKVLSYLRRFRRFLIRIAKKLFNFFKRTKRKFLNKYFRLHKFKFNMLFVQECKDSDIIHCNDLYTLPMGVIVKKFYNKNVKIVYDAHEYETEVNGLTGKKKLFRKFMEKSLIKYADKVICVSDAIANEYVRLYNIKKPALVLNTPPYQEIEKKNFFREELGIQENQTIFLYQGGLSKGRGIEILLETFKSLNNDKSVIVFMGYGPLEELVKEASNDYNNIYFYEAVSPNVLLGFTSSADFGILFYENNCLNHYYCSPNKMFEYLMAGIPVIASNLYEMKRLVENNAIGIVAEDNTPKGLIDAINKAILLDKKELDKNINKVKEVYNWEEQEKVLLSLYKELDE